MDPLTAIGLAGNIVQFIDFGGEVISRLQDFSSDAKDVPQTFREVKIGLPLLLKSIEHIQDDLKNGVINLETQAALEPVIQDCKEQVQRLNKILDETLPAPGDSQWRNVNKALSSFWQDKKVRKIRAIIERYQGGLLLYQVTSPSRRGDAGLERQRPSMGQAVSRSGSTASLPDSSDTATLTTAQTRDQATSYSPRLVPTRVSTTPSLGSPAETIFDSSWSMRTIDTAQTNITIPTPTARKPEVRNNEPAAVEEPSEEPAFLIPEPAIDRPQRMVKAKM
jgi:hypothetical protein